MQKSLLKNQTVSFVDPELEQLNNLYQPGNKLPVNPNRIRFIDLFAGIGGIRLGFERGYSECVFSSEWDKFAQKTYAANFGEMPEGDINAIAISDIPEHDILLGGFPCQPFSSIGKREGFKHDTQGNLFFAIAKILEIKTPSCFLLENVPGLVTHDSGNTFEVILKTLDSLGYDVKYTILDAAEFDLPQYRDRIYIAGFYRKHFTKIVDFKFPVGISNTVWINKFLETDIQGYSISEHLQRTYLFKKDDGRPQLIDLNSEIKVKTLVSSYHKIQRLTGTFVKDGDTGIRLLSEHECKAMMGFPVNFKFPVSRTQMYRQLGNSVAVPVISAIAEQMYQVFK